MINPYKGMSDIPVIRYSSMKLCKILKHLECFVVFFMCFLMLR